LVQRKANSSVRGRREGEERQHNFQGRRSLHPNAFNMNSKGSDSQTHINPQVNSTIRGVGAPSKIQSLIENID
jgi:hypothetical protein